MAAMNEGDLTVPVPSPEALGPKSRLGKQGFQIVIWSVVAITAILIALLSIGAYYTHPSRPDNRNAQQANIEIMTPSLDKVLPLRPTELYICTIRKTWLRSIAIDVGMDVSVCPVEDVSYWRQDGSTRTLITAGKGGSTQLPHMPAKHTFQIWLADDALMDAIDCVVEIRDSRVPQSPDWFAVGLVKGRRLN